MNSKLPPEPFLPADRITKGFPPEPAYPLPPSYEGAEPTWFDNVMIVMALAIGLGLFGLWMYMMTAWP